jgi:hypothetical protein
MATRTSYKAFVSSTFEDLKEHRAHVIRSLERAGFFVDPMEKWPADSEEPKQFSQDRLNDCDLCVLLIAFRRGYVPEGETRSITQLEYEAAMKQGIDILPFLLDENAAWPRKFDELEKDPEMKFWRDYLGKRHGRELFTLDPRSIDMTGALGRWLGKRNAGQPKHPESERIDWPEGKSPYPGLLWFNEEYAPLFFGRDREVDAVLAKMSEPEGRIMIISGTSGSGKSSLIGAGVWRALLKEERLPGSAKWVWLRIQLGDGKSPWNSLAWGLKQALSKVSARPDELANELAGHKTAFGTLLDSQLAQGQELVLFIDQLEELFTQGFKEEDIKGFLDQLLVTACEKAHRLRVVATVRSEFIARLEESESILQIFNAGYNYHLGPVSPRILQEMIEKPAHATGYDFEPGLVEKILHEAAQEPGSLPLVAYTLDQLFKRRRGRTLEQEAYKAIGGVAGAIGTKADQSIESLDEPVRRAFDKVFAELVHIERDRPATRNRAFLSVFAGDAAANQFINALAGHDCRVLVRGDEKREATVEVAHERLFAAWPKLKDWIDNGGEALRLIDHATEAARRWHERANRVEGLWSGAAATEVLTGIQRFEKKPTKVLKRFLKPQLLLIAQLKQGTLSHRDRLRIGMKLSEFGDSRRGVGLRSDGLPDIKWVAIPPGRVQLDEVDHVFEVPRFRISKYPVTNVQFEAFIQADDGYRHDEWWKGIQRGEAIDPSWTWTEANGPRETVSWFEAVAFCRWLSSRMHTTIRLPTEWEWQQAATGGDPTREYSWGGEWDGSRCNSHESRLRRTSAVGMYPSGATQQGVLDMQGNVWEWCLNTKNQPETSKALHIDETNALRAVRGGSWHCDSILIRAASRAFYFAVSRGSEIGIRLVQDIP